MGDDLPPTHKRTPPNRAYIYVSGEENGSPWRPRGRGSDAVESRPQHIPLPDAHRARADLHRDRVPAIRAAQFRL